MKRPQLMTLDRRMGIWIAGTSLVAFLWWSSSLEISIPQLLLSFAFLTAAIMTYLDWANSEHLKIPVWPLVCAMHFVFYGMALFNGSRQSPSYFDHGDLPEAAISGAMAIGLVGLIAIGCGRRISPPRRR